MIAAVLLAVGLGLPLVYTGTFLSQVNLQAARRGLGKGRAVHTVRLDFDGITVTDLRKEEPPVVVKWKDVRAASRRRVLAHTDALMIVEVGFEAGSAGAVHTHPHCQNTCVRSGRFRFVIDGEPAGVGPGDTLAFPPNLPHGALCLERGVLLDIFAPMREDFL